MRIVSYLHTLTALGYNFSCNKTTESHICPFLENRFSLFICLFIYFSTTPAHDLNLFPVMASDGSPSQDSQKKKKKTSRKGKGEGVKDTEIQVESLTACGHGALQQGDSSKALEYFKKAFKTAVNVRKVLRD